MMLMIKLLTCSEAAEALKVSQGTIRNWVCAKKIPFKKANGKVLFSVTELQDWLEAQTNKKSKNTHYSTGKEFNAAALILSSCGFEPKTFTGDNKTIDFTAILSRNLSSQQKALVSIAANLYDLKQYKTDFCGNLSLLDSNGLHLVLSAIKLRF